MNSVVICAYASARWPQIEEAIRSIEVQPTVDEVVLVVDHNPELLERSRQAWPTHHVVANRFGQGLSGARNTGIIESAGDVIAFLDDDAVAVGDWMERLLEPFDQPGVGGVGGRVLPAWVAEQPPWFPSEFLWVVGCSYVGQPERSTTIRNPIGANMAFRREVFERVGGFREEIGRVGTVPLGCEETELSIRAGAAGYTIVYQPDAIVHHLVPDSRGVVRYFLQRCLAEGMSKATVSSMAGSVDGLSSERSYLTRTLPSGVATGLRQTVVGPRRAAAAGRVAAIVGGVGAACAGFARGTLASRSSRAPGPQPAPDVSARLHA